jgi:hypothetical protein
VPTAEVIEAPPLPAAAALIWFNFAFSKATLQFVKARGARWCNVRCGWYMYSTISTPIQIEEVLQRCERTATPGRDRNPREVGSSRSRFVKCTRPCLSCSPMYMATLISCIVPAEATAATVYWQHLGGLTPMTRFLYGVLFITAIAQLSKRMHRLGTAALVVSTVKGGAAAGGAAVHRLGCAVLQYMGATALTIDGFMTQVRARHSQSLTAYYMATTIFAVMVASVLLMAGAPASWCASMPLASAVAALFFVQSPPALIGTVTVPGSQMVMGLQAVLVGGWCAGTVPMDVVLAPLPAVAVYIAAAYAVTRKLRSRELGIFLLIIIVLAGSIPASFIHIPAADLEPALITTPLIEEPDSTAAAARAVAYHATPATVMSSAATATTSATTSMACAAMALLQSNVPSELLPGCGIQLPPALQKQLALEGDFGEWMHDNGAGNKHITPFITDFAEWTSSTRTTLGGIGADALVSYTPS